MTHACITDGRAFGPPRPLRGLGHVVTTIASAVALVTGLAGPASAHYVYENHLTYESDTKCLNTRSEISHGDGGGYAKTDSKSLRHNQVLGNCESRDPVPPGWLAAQANILVYLGGSGGRNGWYLCRQYGGAWDYNAKKASELWMAIKPYMEDPPCGPRYYGNLSYSAVYFNGKWIVGGLWSGSHSLS